jgi:RNA polymerase-binding transcription factor DksA
MLNTEQREKLRHLLENRHREWREEIRQGLLDTRDQHFIDLAGQVRDLEEASVADLLVDIDLSMIDKHVGEIRDIDSAFLRMRTGSYGVCTDCGEAIAPPRLAAFPTAKRCRPCQENYERSHAGNSTPTL